MGKKDVLEGESLTDAFTKAGYGAGAVKAIDFTANGEDDSYIWDSKNKEWVSNG